VLWMNYKANSFNDESITLPILRHKTGSIVPVVTLCGVPNWDWFLPRIPNSAKSKAQDLVYPISHPGYMELRRSVRFSLSQEIDELGEFYD